MSQRRRNDEANFLSLKANPGERVVKEIRSSILGIYLEQTRELRVYQSSAPFKEIGMATFIKNWLICDGHGVIERHVSSC